MGTIKEKERKRLVGKVKIYMTRHTKLQNDKHTLIGFAQILLDPNPSCRKRLRHRRQTIQTKTTFQI